jgi:hypothetical protein
MRIKVRELEAKIRKIMIYIKSPGLRKLLEQQSSKSTQDFNAQLIQESFLKMRAQIYRFSTYYSREQKMCVCVQVHLVSRQRQKVPAVESNPEYS